MAKLKTIGAEATEAEAVEVVAEVDPVFAATKKSVATVGEQVAELIGAEVLEQTETTATLRKGLESVTVNTVNGVEAAKETAVRHLG